MKEDNYEDIINMKHHTSAKHPRLSKEQRAAQFAPFAALTGYEEQIEEASKNYLKKWEVNEHDI